MEEANFLPYTHWCANAGNIPGNYYGGTYKLYLCNIRRGQIDIPLMCDNYVTNGFGDYTFYKNSHFLPVAAAVSMMLYTC